MLFTLTVIFWPFTLPAYYLFLIAYALTYLRPLSAQPGFVRGSYLALLVMPILSLPIFWFCYHVWHPYPDSYEWGADENGETAFLIPLTIAGLLFLATLVPVPKTAKL